MNRRTFLAAVAGAAVAPAIVRQQAPAAAALKAVTEAEGTALYGTPFLRASSIQDLQDAMSRVYSEAYFVYSEADFARVDSEVVKWDGDRFYRP